LKLSQTYKAVYAGFKYLQSVYQKRIQRLIWMDFQTKIESQIWDYYKLPSGPIIFSDVPSGSIMLSDAQPSNLISPKFGSEIRRVYQQIAPVFSQCDQILDPLQAQIIEDGEILGPKFPELPWL